MPNNENFSIGFTNNSFRISDYIPLEKLKYYDLEKIMLRKQKREKAFPIEWSKHLLKKLVNVFWYKIFE